MSETIKTTAPVETPEESGSGRVSWGILIVIAVAVLFIVVLAVGMQRAAVDRPDDVAPDFEMQFFNGYDWEGKPSATLADFRGRPVVLNFWASWCVECKVEADLLEQTWRDYHDEGVIFLGVAYIDVEPKSLEYLAEFNITYPNAPDLRSSISDKYDITGVPETFFIDKGGNVVHIQLGPVNKTLLIGLIDQMLAADTTG